MKLQVNCPARPAAVDETLNFYERPVVRVGQNKLIHPLSLHFFLSVSGWMSSLSCGTMARETLSCVSRCEWVAGHAGRDGPEYRQGAWSCLEVDDSTFAPTSCSSSSRWIRDRRPPTSTWETPVVAAWEQPTVPQATKHFQTAVASIVSCSHRRLR